jgi:shikimate dehydrogenase
MDVDSTGHPLNKRKTADVGSILVGLVGRGIQQSRTPAMHEAAGDALGLRYMYKIIDADHTDPACQDIADILDYAQNLGFSGLNITFPFKQQVTSLLDRLDGDAKMLDSVNTVIFDGNRKIGYNTDLSGFRAGFVEGMAEAALGSVLLVGAGGAGVAVAHALAHLGVETLFILDRDERRAGDLAAKLNASGGTKATAVESGIIGSLTLDGIVNATPVGMNKSPGLPIDDAVIRPHLWVADIIYLPIDTELLRIARGRGCRTMNGAGMAVHQAVRAFELFTGMEPDKERMKAVFADFDR